MVSGGDLYQLMGMRRLGCGYSLPAEERINPPSRTGNDKSTAEPTPADNNALARQAAGELRHRSLDADYDCVHDHGRFGRFPNI